MQLFLSEVIRDDFIETLHLEVLQGLCQGAGGGWIFIEIGDIGSWKRQGDVQLAVCRYHRAAHRLAISWKEEKEVLWLIWKFLPLQPRDGSLLTKKHGLYSIWLMSREKGMPIFGSTWHWQLYQITQRQKDHLCYERQKSAMWLQDPLHATSSCSAGGVEMSPKPSAFPHVGPDPCQGLRPSKTSPGLSGCFLHNWR